MISSAHSASASGSAGRCASTGTVPMSAPTRSRGSSIYTGSENSRALRSTRAMSAAAWAGSSRMAWSQVSSRNSRAWLSSARAMWCNCQPAARSGTPGAPEITTTGERSAKAPAIGFIRLKAPAPQVTTATPIAPWKRAAASAAKPTAGS